MKQENCPILLQHKKNNMIVCFKTPKTGVILRSGKSNLPLFGFLNNLDHREFHIIDYEVILLNDNIGKIENTGVFSSLQDPNKCLNCI
jgi:hypothetical protein